MKLNYINKIKANISIYASKKTTNLLDGTYNSIYRGKSTNFENLREYVIGDDIKDIDWKSSARSGTILVKQYIALKKHNIMLIMDTAKSFMGDTDSHESKKDIALYVAGTIGYIAIKNNDYVGMSLYHDNKIEFKPFKYDLYKLEEYLCYYDKSPNTFESSIEKVLEFVYNNISRRMIIFIVTDMKGVGTLKDNTLKKLSQRHDVLVVNINDNYMFGENIYDINTSRYIPNFFLHDKTLNELEHQIKNNINDDNLKKVKKNNICMTSISSVKEINQKIIELLEEHKYARHF